ncbi:hypothetical protein [Tenacibaculum discolor]|uniref:hypothetical protein n=1 Tax=Tenacibaculum discolor TaxID=361581 RepID=UPI003F795B1E
MKTLIRKYIVQRWWIPTIFFFTSIFLFFFASYLQFPNPHIIGIAGLLFLFTASIIQLFNKKWLAGISNLGLTFCTIFIIGVFVLSFMGMFRPDTDTFADNLKLPENVELEKPIDTKLGENFEAIRPENIKSISKDKIDFQLYNSSQSGLYEYDIWINSNQNGTIFLKVFEITQEIQLSTSSVRERSSLRISNTNGVIEKFSTKDDFTIYEGDWGKPYGARFEIWFKPDNGKSEKKLMEKNYIIEGWMR